MTRVLMIVTFVAGLGEILWGLVSPLNPTLIAMGAVAMSLPLFLDPVPHRKTPVRQRKRPSVLAVLWGGIATSLRAYLAANRRIFEALVGVWRGADGVIAAEERRTALDFQQQRCKHTTPPEPVVVKYPETGLAKAWEETVGWLCPDCRADRPAPRKPKPRPRPASRPARPPAGGQVEPNKAVHPRVNPGPTPDDDYCGFCADWGHDTKDCTALDHVKPRFDSHEEWADALRMLREDLSVKSEQMRVLVGEFTSDGNGVAHLSQRQADEYKALVADATALRDQITLLVDSEPPLRKRTVVEPEDGATRCPHCEEPYEFENVMSHQSSTPVRVIRQAHECEVPIFDPDTGEHLGDLGLSTAASNMLTPSGLALTAGGISTGDVTMNPGGIVIGTGDFNASGPGRVSIVTQNVGPRARRYSRQFNDGGPEPRLPDPGRLRRR